MPAWMLCLQQQQPPALQTQQGALPSCMSLQHSKGWGLSHKLSRSAMPQLDPHPVCLQQQSPAQAQQVAAGFALTLQGAAATWAPQEAPQQQGPPGQAPLQL